MKLRLFSGLLIVFLLASLTCIPALADAIFEPSDTFYQVEFKNCVYTNRYYTANGKEGTVAVLKEPGSDETVASINNGNEFYVSFTYTDKDSVPWGVVEFNPDGSGNLGTIDYSKDKPKSGWIVMTDLKVVYDYISFAEDHQSEFRPYTGYYDVFKTSVVLMFWSYPGSGEIVLQDSSLDIDENFNFSHTYTDTEGRQWGFIEYYYGIRNLWICISDPTGAGIETVLTPTPDNEMQASPVSETPMSPSGEVSTAPSDNKPVVQNNSTSMLLIIAVAMVALVVVTGVIIMVFWKKNTKKDQAIK